MLKLKSSRALAHGDKFSLYKKTHQEERIFGCNSPSFPDTFIYMCEGKAHTRTHCDVYVEEPWSLADAQVGDMFTTAISDFTHTVRYVEPATGMVVATYPNELEELRTGAWRPGTLGIAYVGREAL
jgi:hypothetical protein